MINALCTDPILSPTPSSLTLPSPSSAQCLWFICCNMDMTYACIPAWNWLWPNITCPFYACLSKELTVSITCDSHNTWPVKKTKYYSMSKRYNTIQCQNDNEMRKILENKYIQEIQSIDLDEVSFDSHALNLYCTLRALKKGHYKLLSIFWYWKEVFLH